MKSLQRLCGAVVLTLTLNLSVFAGEIHTPKTDPTPPPSASTEGDIQIPATSSEGGAVDPTMEIALSLLESILSLF